MKKPDIINLELTRTEINTMIWYLMPPANLVERDKLLHKLMEAKRIK